MMSKKSPKAWLGSVAAVTTASLLLLIAPSPATAANLAEAANRSTISPAQKPEFRPAPHAVPAVESALGKGTALSSEAGARVDLGAGAASGQSALVRVTVPAADAGTEVRTGSAPILSAPAGVTASTTVLLPVSNGTVSLWAERPGDVRVEVLAWFGGAALSPGATVALPEPVKRADTRDSLAGTQLSNTALWVGLTGTAGVPATGVRSVYLTLNVELTAADRLLVGTDQELALPKGRSIVTTVVEPDAAGGVDVALKGSAPAASLRADVLGWVVEAPADTTQANMAGSYVAATQLDAPTTTSLTAGGSAADLPLADHADVAYSLALISSVPERNGGQTTVLQTAAEPFGRAQGIAVDGVSGAAPQLAMVPLEQARGKVSIRRGAAAVTVQPLGGFLGDTVPAARGEEPVIEITAPRDLGHVDISGTGFFTLEGTVRAGANAIDRIEISSPSVGFIGMAELDFGDDLITWQFSAAAPEDGDFDYVATVFDRGHRGKAAASDRVALSVDVSDGDDTVVTPEAKVFNQSSAQVDFTVLSEHQIAFADRPELEPGDIVVGGANAGSPEGYLGRVASMDLLNGQWIVRTVGVTIAELVFQAEIDETFDFEDGDGVEVADLPADAADPTELMTASYALANDDGSFAPEQEVEVLSSEDSGEGENAELFTGSEVDLELDSADFDLPDVEVLCREAGADAQEPTGGQIDENGQWQAAGGEIAAAPAACGDAPALRASGLHKNWSLGMDANLLMAYENGKFNFKNQTGAPEEKQEAERRVAITKKMAVAVQARAQIAATVDVDLSVSYKFKYKVVPAGVKVNNFSVKLTTELNAQAAVQAYVERKARLDFSQKIAEVGLPTITVTLGPVPVVITNALKTSMGISAEVKAQVDLPAVGVSRTDVFGFKYTSETGLKRIKEDVPTKYATPTFRSLVDNIEVELSGMIAVGPQITYGSKIYGFAGPELTLYGLAGVDGLIKGHPALGDFKGELNVFVKAGLLGEAKLKIIKWELLSITVFNMSWRVNLFTKKF